jgi:hypothetical protein
MLETQQDNHSNSPMARPRRLSKEKDEGTTSQTMTTINLDTYPSVQILLKKKMG